MTWMEIRAHYAALHAQAQAAGQTQQAIADRGGIAGQNSVSRLLSNDNLGPSVEIFVRAVEGMGKSVSEFFLEIEQGALGLGPSGIGLEATVTDRLDRLEQMLETLRARLSSLSLSAAASVAASGPGAQAPPDTRAGRPLYGYSSLSPGVVNHNYFAPLDQPRFEALVQAQVEAIRAQLDARLAKLGAGDGTSAAKKPTARGAHRRRATATLA
jgi:transcriptional regulator with XRE-family HTH domain